MAKGSNSRLSPPVGGGLRVGAAEEDVQLLQSTRTQSSGCPSCHEQMLEADQVLHCPMNPVFLRPTLCTARMGRNKRGVHLKRGARGRIPFNKEGFPLAGRQGG